jgi:hypothetical protein
MKKIPRSSVTRQTQAVCVLNSVIYSCSVTNTQWVLNPGIYRHIVFRNNTPEPVCSELRNLPLSLQYGSGFLESTYTLRSITIIHAQCSEHWNPYNAQSVLNLESLYSCSVIIQPESGLNISTPESTYVHEILESILQIFHGPIGRFHPSKYSIVKVLPY